MLFNKNRALVFIFIILALVLSFSPGRGYASGLIATPQIIFHNSQDKSARFSVNNPTDKPIEVSVEIKYGYHTSDDTGKLVIVTTDTLLPDDRSAALWMRAFPDRFTLLPHEGQTVRLVVTPPPGIIAGEYWARIILTSKDIQAPRPSKQSVTTSVTLVSSTSLPYHYRYLLASTGLQLTRSIEAKVNPGSVDVLLPLRRSGTAAFWGTLTCRILNSAGQSVYTKDHRLVVYKDFVFALQVDRSSIPPGSYTIELTAKTERTDVKRTDVLQVEPIKWTVPVNIF